MKFLTTILESSEFIFGLLLLIGFIIWLIKTPWRKNTRQLIVEIFKKPIGIFFILAGMVFMFFGHDAIGTGGLVIIGFGLGILVGGSMPK